MPVINFLSCKYLMHSLALLLSVLLLSGCSSTSSLEEGEQLYVGIKDIEYKNYERNAHFITTREEIEAGLAAAPNGSFMGSSTIRLFPWRLWVYNATANKNGALSRWLNNSFGEAPKLMSDVNGKLRSSVAKSMLHSYGYFRGNVDYEEIAQSNPKKGKISYMVDCGPLFRYDSIAYVNYPESMDTLINKTLDKSLIKRDDGFSVSNLDQERQRLSKLFRNAGFYYYEPGYSSYLADTLAVPEKVQLRLQLADSLDRKVYKQWYIGNTDIYLRKSYMHELPDSIKRRTLTVHFSGKKSPVRPGAILANMKLRPRMPFSQDLYNESMTRLSANDIFSMVDISFTPRDTTEQCDILDMKVDMIFDKPYSISLEGNITGKTSSRIGPGAEFKFTKKNAFRGAENLSFKLYGSFESQVGGSGYSNNLGLNSYEYGGDITLEIPRLLLPARVRRRWDYLPSTVLKASNQVISRGSYFNRHIMSGELTYMIKPTETSKHIISPLILEYDYMNWMSDEFRAILITNPYLKVSMQDQFIPKLRYTYTYTSPERFRNPIMWESTFSESANLLSVGYAVFGHGWKERNKPLLKNPYAQFLKFETDFTKKWRVGDKTDLVGHVNAGVIWAYGNSTEAPYSEQFYVGGANSIRAFTIRSIGPGRYHTNIAGASYLEQTGDIKFVANLEYRPHLFGNLYGALFIDAGNVWAMKNDGFRGEASVFKPTSLIKDMAIATGLGFRYDLDFFVIRIDWGVGLHMPYNTGKSGFFNIRRFKDVQSLHLAVGYPF